MNRPGDHRHHSKHKSLGMTSWLRSHEAAETCFEGIGSCFPGKNRLKEDSLYCSWSGEDAECVTPYWSPPPRRGRRLHRFASEDATGLEEFGQGTPPDPFNWPEQDSEYAPSHMPAWKTVPKHSYSKSVGNSKSLYSPRSLSSAVERETRSTISLGTPPEPFDLPEQDSEYAPPHMPAWKTNLKHSYSKSVGNSKSFCSPRSLSSAVERETRSTTNLGEMLEGWSNNKSSAPSPPRSRSTSFRPAPKICMYAAGELQDEKIGQQPLQRQCSMPAARNFVHAPVYNNKKKNAMDGLKSHPEKDAEQENNVADRLQRLQVAAEKCSALVQVLNKYRMDHSLCISKCEAYMANCQCQKKNEGSDRPAPRLCPGCMMINERTAILTHHVSTSELQTNDLLTEAAQDWAEKLHQFDEIKDPDPSGQGLFQRMSSKGDWTTYVGETVLVDAKNVLETSPEEMLIDIICKEGESWENLFSNRFSLIGFGLFAREDWPSVVVLNFAGDFGPVLKKALPCSFTRYTEASGSISKEMDLLLNCIPFLELRKFVRVLCRDQPEIVIRLELSPGEVQVLLIDKGVSKALQASWKLKIQPHRAYYSKLCDGHEAFGEFASATPKKELYEENNVGGSKLRQSYLAPPSMRPMHRNPQSKTYRRSGSAPIRRRVSTLFK